MANIEVGDKVRFLNEVGQGIVTRIQNKLVYVLTDEGFEIPVQANQLVVVEKVSNTQSAIIINDADTMNYNYAERDDKYYEPETFENQSDKSEPLSNDLYVAFVPTQGKAEYRDLFLINDSEHNFTFCLFVRKNNDYEFLETGLLESGTKVFIKELSKEEVAQIVNITLQGVIYRPEENKVGKLLNKELKVNALYLLNISYFNENDFFDEPAFLFSVLQAEKNQQLIKQQKLEEDIKETIKPIKENVEKPDLVEVDLHIHALVDDYKDLTPSEMLHMQLSHFRKKMEEYILTPTVKKVVFIHGVGNGTLKIELRRILSREYAHYDYQDASYQEYGFGATMVILRK
ncbi:MAG: DUF2027 domain-containing protein [Bacteroidales bacterium]|nr:DUF2027 domain-containing protein [Bacteroidales bacterium]